MYILITFTITAFWRLQIYLVVQFIQHSRSFGSLTSYFTETIYFRIKKVHSAKLLHVRLFFYVLSIEFDLLCYLSLLNFMYTGKITENYSVIIYHKMVILNGIRTLSSKL